MDWLKVSLAFKQMREMTMTMKLQFFGLLILALSTTFSGASAEDRIVEYQASAVRIHDNSAIVRYQKDYWVTSVTGIVGRISDLERVKIGDKIRVGDKTVVANIILVTEYREDIKWQGKIMARKGDTSCLIVERKQDIPSDEERDRIWINVKKCSPIR